MDWLDEHKRQPLALAQHQQCRGAHSLCSDCGGRGAYACHHDWQDRLRSGVLETAAVHCGVHVEEDGVGLYPAYAFYIIDSEFPVWRRSTGGDRGATQSAVDKFA